MIFRYVTQMFSVLALGLSVCVAHPAEAARSKPGSLDGATVYTIENFRQLGSHQVTVGYGLYPMDPYYTAFDLSGAYSYFFTDNFGWEVLRFGYFFNSKTDLTQELADKFSVNPTVIDTPKSALSSSVLYVFSYGKQLFLNRYFFYNRYMAVLGLGQMNSVQRSSYVGVLGLRGDFAVDERFSWTVEGRYNIATNPKQDNQLGLLLGSAYNF
jgi:hypothetical protein